MSVPFGPRYEDTKSLSVTSTSGSVNIPSSSDTLHLVNDGSHSVTVVIQAASAATAVFGVGLVLLPASDILVTTPAGVSLYVSAIADTGKSSTLYATPGVNG